MPPAASPAETSAAPHAPHARVTIHKVDRPRNPALWEYVWRILLDDDPPRSHDPRPDRFSLPKY
jgi:hypothetical protein